MAEDDKTATTKTKKETRAPWTWGELAADSSPTLQVLILRYLANPQCGGYSREELRKLGKAESVDIVTQALYGRKRRAAAALVKNIAESLGSSIEELTIAAKAWQKSGSEEPEYFETIPLRGSDIERKYYFRKNWLQSMDTRAEDLFAIKVPDKLLAEYGLYEGDLLLVDSTDRQFWPGAFFIVECKNMLRIYCGSVQFNEQYLCVDQRGVLKPMLFSEANVLGRAIWIGTNLR